LPPTAGAVVTMACTEIGCVPVPSVAAVGAAPSNLTYSTGSDDQGQSGSSDPNSPVLDDSPYNPSNVDDRVKPPYQANPAHNSFTSSYNPDKTPEPPDAQSVYENSAVRGGMKRWYGKGQDGYYQYYSDNVGNMHFGGTIDSSVVPNKVLKQLKR